jgi:hypothetical protein
MMMLSAVLYGAFAAFVFRRTTDPGRLRRTANQILARIMEFRLFVDEPLLIWRAQVGALKANWALLRQVAIPCAVMAIMFAILYSPMERRFGHASLRVGEATVLTTHSNTVPHIDGIAIETPGVRIARTGEVSWRGRPIRDTIGEIPRGIEIESRRTGQWLLWFFAISSVSALAVARTI